MAGLSNVGRELDLNERINLRGIIEAWVRITVEHHQDDLSTKLYGSRISKKGVQKSLLSAGYRFGSGRSRTNQLRQNWRSSVAGSDADLRTQYSFLQYGRFVDMGVGKGTDYALSKYQSVKKNGEPRTRRPVRWYSKRKGYELHRLREILCDNYVSIPLEALENALTAKVELTV